MDQIIEDGKNIVALEWAEKMGELLPQQRIEIHCQNLGENKRKIQIQKYE